MGKSVNVRKRSAPKELVKAKKQKQNNHDFGNRHESPVHVQLQNELTIQQPTRVVTSQYQSAAGSNEKEVQNGERTKRSISKTRLVDVSDNSHCRKRSATQESVKAKQQKNDKKGFGNRHESLVQVQSPNVLTHQRPIRVKKRRNHSTADSNGKQAQNGNETISFTSAADANHEDDYVSRESPE